jgi:predicted regulator of Ras-like GTPase activity (Roadblock/LC7/MglB family)
VSGFADALREIAARVPETRAAMILGADGIAVERLVVRADANSETLAAELTTLLRASRSVSNDTGLGPLQELSVASENVTALIRAITPEYFLFVAIGPGALVGRAWLAMRLAALGLEQEFA